jgi:histone deacetylase HOS3
MSAGVNDSFKLNMPQSQRPRRAAVFFQDACYQHHYIRSRDLSSIVERPERLRAVLIGLAAAIARLEDAVPQTSKSELMDNSKDLETDGLTAALGRMNLAPDSSKSGKSPVSIVQTSAVVDILNHPAVKFVHGDVDGDVYLENLKNWARDSRDKILEGGSEIPEGLSQGDLYRKYLSTILSTNSNSRGLQQSVRSLSMRFRVL